MGYKRLQVQDGDLSLPAKMRVGDGWLANPGEVIQATDSNQTLNSAAMIGGLYVRNGMTAARTDTTDTATLLAAACVGMDIGDSFIFGVSVTTAFAWNIAAGAGVTLVGKTQVPASGFGLFRVVRTGALTFTIRGL